MHQVSRKAAEDGSHGSEQFHNLKERFSPTIAEVAKTNKHNISVDVMETESNNKIVIELALCLWLSGTHGLPVCSLMP